MSTLQRLADRGLIKPPRWLPGNVQYETIMGSVAYGVSSDTSDVDVYGWAVPRKEDVFPHLRGEIAGFGKPAERFEQYQEHHVEDRLLPAGQPGDRVGQLGDLGPARAALLLDGRGAGFGRAGLGGAGGRRACGALAGGLLLGHANGSSWDGGVRVLLLAR